MEDDKKKRILETLPGMNCGSCGFKTCEELADAASKGAANTDRCVNLSSNAKVQLQLEKIENSGSTDTCDQCGLYDSVSKGRWKDFLGREYDFVLQTFPNEPGPRETILPHNPALTRELEIKKGDILIGRPLGMSCGCPITHCGVVMDADYKTGVIVWCVTGPLQPRAKGFKDMGYYIAEAYEGIIKETRAELKVGMRYWFQPQRCMLQWRHSGLINFLTRTKEGTQVRIEGLMIG
ncbi:MAG: (Fe-S)-binding protein [Candidatus Micrarchaeaceae archaeon]|nr:Fe-S cluster protein [Candidatus Micrarchaeota archaeon]HII10319.1 Fe-S cluster protein [Candidatus Micrarchaeota archaeon]